VNKQPSFDEDFQSLLRTIANSAERGELMPEHIAGNRLTRLFVECGVTQDDLADIELQKNARQRLADALRRAKFRRA
jgi:hypothetical protein